MIDVLVETPKGSRSKYEWDHDQGGLRLDRRLYSATVFPADYGYVPETRSADGQALDALVLSADGTFPGCWVRARPIWCVAAAMFALAGVAVGALRAGGGTGLPLAAAMALLTLVLAVGSGISSWQHASVAADLLDHLERAERDAAARWMRAARAPVLVQYDTLGEQIDVRWDTFLDTSLFAVFGLTAHL